MREDTAEAITWSILIVVCVVGFVLVSIYGSP